MLKLALAGVSAALLLASGSSVSAEVTLSASNNPAITLNERLGSLFDAERTTLTTFRSKDIARLSAIPKSPDAAPGTISEEKLRRMAAPTGGKNFACLAEALYFEARGEELKGVVGVAEVILNRVEDPRYPDDVCSVVNQGTGERYRCQFTYTCDGRPETITEERAYLRVAKVARLMLDGAPRRLTAGATHYHTKSVSPRWSRVFPRTATLGYHHFYREPSRVARR